MANDELRGPAAAADPDEAHLSRMVAAYVDSVPVPDGLVETDWRSRRGPTIRWVGAGAGPTSRLGALSALAAVLSVVVLAVVIGLVGRVPLPQAASTPGGATGPAVSAALPGSSAAPSAPSPAPSGTPAAPDLAGSPWFSMWSFGGCPANSPSEPLSACSGTTGSRPGSLELFVGTLDGRVTLHVQRSLPVSAGLWVGRGSLPDAAGPFGGKVLYSLFDGSQSEIHVVDVRSGSDDTVVTTANVVYNAVLDPLSGTLYFGQLDPARRHDLGVWRVGPGDASQPEQFLAPAGHVYGGSQQWSRTLLITPDGGRLVVRDCQDATCVISVYATADGHLVASADGLQDDAVFGLTDSVLVGGMGCDGGRCSIGTVDLASGQVRGLTDDPCALSGSGVLAARPDGTPVLLVPSAPGAACAPAGSVLTIELAGSSAKTVWAPDGRDPATGAVLSLAVQAQGTQGYAVPDGWALVAPNQELAYTNQSGSLTPQLVGLAGQPAIPLSIQPHYAP